MRRPLAGVDENRQFERAKPGQVALEVNKPAGVKKIFDLNRGISENPAIKFWSPDGSYQSSSKHIAADMLIRSRNRRLPRPRHAARDGASGITRSEDIFVSLADLRPAARCLFARRFLRRPCQLHGRHRLYMGTSGRICTGGARDRIVAVRIFWISNREE